MCDDAPPPHWRGPGDQHSQQEWVWRRADYERLFERAPAERRPGREHAVLPVAPRSPAQDRRAPARGQADRRRPRPDRPRLQQLDAPVVRRPRARSPTSRRRSRRSTSGSPRAGRRSGATPSSAGTASSWRTCSAMSTGSGCWCCATATIVDDPRGAVDRTCDSSGSRPAGRLHPARQQPQLRRAGTRAGRPRPRSCEPAPGPGSSRRHRCGAAPAPRSSGGSPTATRHRPKLSEQARARLLPFFADDIALLAQITGENFDDWLSTESRGSFQERRVVGG